MGDQHDGGYVLCSNFVKGRSTALLNMGVEGRDMFGCDVTTKWSMPNYQFDCTNNRAPICNTNDNQNKFFGICLWQRAEKSSRWHLESLKDMIDNRGLTKKHIMIKMDVEGGEYKGFRTLPV